MNNDFSDSKLQAELGIELAEAVERIRNSAPDADRVQSSVAAMDALIEDSNRNTLVQDRQASNGVDWETRFSWIGSVALAVLVGVGLVLYFITVPVQQVTAAQIARSIAAQDWVHATETFSDGAKLESWFSPSLNISAISNEERIEFRDHGQGESFEFLHESQTIFLVSESETPRQYSHWSKLATYLPIMLAEGLPDNPIDHLPGFDSGKERIEFIGHSIEPAADSDELEYSIQCLLDKSPLDIVFFIDPQTKLPLRSVMTGIREGKEVSCSVDLAYSDDGPVSIYDLGVPQNAKLVNRTDSGMRKALRDAVYAGAEEFDDYRAVMVKHRVGDKLWWRNARVEIICRKGDCFTRRSVPRFERTRKEPREGADLHEWWEKQISLAHGGPDGIPSSVVRGEEVWHYDRALSTFEKLRNSYADFYCWSLRPDMIARPPLGGSAAHLEIRVDENPESGPSGTILYEIIQGEGDYSVTRSWIDPNQGYLVVQSEMGTDEEWKTQTIVEKAAKSPSGIWYPQRLRTRTRRRDGDGTVYEDVTNCYVDFESAIPDRLFEVK